MNNCDKSQVGPSGSCGLFVLRVGAAAMMFFGHGLEKLLSYSEKSATFPDPLGVSPEMSMALAIFAECFCSLAVIAGFYTRAAVIPLITTMLVAAVIVHADDPWSRKEFALIYMLPFLALFFTGPGRYSLDAYLGSKRKQSAATVPTE